jgi:hypothetical protein
MVAFSSAAMAQSETESFCEECIKKLSDARFNFLKSYRVNGENGGLQRAEYSYVLTKGSKYMVNICANAQCPEKIQFTLSDYNRTKVTSNMVGGRLLSDLVFECSATGIYYFQYNFGEAAVSCAGISIGFAR